jgi:hypothetical protein
VAIRGTKSAAGAASLATESRAITTAELFEKSRLEREGA